MTAIMLLHALLVRLLRIMRMNMNVSVSFFLIIPIVLKLKNLGMIPAKV